MAERRYSQADQAKRMADRIHNLREKGVNVQSVQSLHPGGLGEALKQMEKEVSSVRDQSQEQVAKGNEKFAKDNKARRQKQYAEAAKVAKKRSK